MFFRSIVDYNNGKVSLEEENIIKDIINLFRQEKETKAIKNKILRDIKNLFEQEKEGYYEPVKVIIFGKIIILNKKVTMIEIKHYQLKKILIKLDHT